MIAHRLITKIILFASLSQPTVLVHQTSKKMKEDAPTVITVPSATTTATTPSVVKKESSEGSSLFGKTRYKFWVLSAILLLAFWSMFTGSVTLKWSTGSLSHLPEDLELQNYDDVDILEVEEKEKVVRHMWDVYTHSTSGIRLPRFWEQAFQAAYESLASDVPAVRDAAISEIAKLSIRSTILDHFQLTESARQRRKNLKQAKGR